jgi:hypothetical protein
LRNAAATELLTFLPLAAHTPAKFIAPMLDLGIRVPLRQNLMFESEFCLREPCVFATVALCQVGDVE